MRLAETQRQSSRLKKRVLVVDDDPAIRSILATILEISGFAVVTAGNGVEAIERVDTHSPAVMILDRWMPVLDGTGVVQQLRARGIELPIIVMTVDGKTWADEINADGYLDKPFDLTDVVLRVRQIVQN